MLIHEIRKNPRNFIKFMILGQPFIHFYSFHTSTKMNERTTKIFFLLLTFHSGQNQKSFLMAINQPRVEKFVLLTQKKKGKSEEIVWKVYDKNINNNSGKCCDMRTKIFCVLLFSSDFSTFPFLVFLSFPFWFLIIVVFVCSVNTKAISISSTSIKLEQWCGKQLPIFCAFINKKEQANQMRKQK